MFPPSSPLTDRVRAQAELDALEKDAMFYAQSQPTRPSLLKHFSLRRTPSQQSAPADHPICVIHRNPSAAES